eukprot:388351-Ditylum_brightwellii.AAC.1
MVDHASSYSYSHFITGATNEQTVAAKLVFDSEDFTNSCKAAQQTYFYCGIGGHHQNGIAENMN